ncbi:hypothetical protein O3P69_015999 [Scylla paramamosain]|uniref:Secreted protein n=1 Tax=Scylla paramamosain TaxID=85552 RepID=A0AAW0TAG6_SCYPA
MESTKHFTLMLLIFQHQVVLSVAQLQCYGRVRGVGAPAVRCLQALRVAACGIASPAVPKHTTWLLKLPRKSILGGRLFHSNRSGVW